MGVRHQISHSSAHQPQLQTVFLFWNYTSPSYFNNKFTRNLIRGDIRAILSVDRWSRTSAVSIALDTPRLPKPGSVKLTSDKARPKTSSTIYKYQMVSFLSYLAL